MKKVNLHLILVIFASSVAFSVESKVLQISSERDGFWAHSYNIIGTNQAVFTGSDGRSHSLYLSSENASLAFRCLDVHQKKSSYFLKDYDYVLNSADLSTHWGVEFLPGDKFSGAEIYNAKNALIGRLIVLSENKIKFVETNGDEIFSANRVQAEDKSKTPY